MPDRFAGIPYDSIKDRATREAFRRLTGALGNMFLTGSGLAERPVSARFGAFWVNQADPNDVYWYAGEAIGWLQVHSETPEGPSVLHETLTDLQGGAAGDHKHLTGVQQTALTTHQAFGATRVLFADADGHINHDAALAWIGASTLLDVQGDGLFRRDGASRYVRIAAHSDTATHTAQQVFRKSKGTFAAPTALASGDDIGYMAIMQGYDGSAYFGAFQGFVETTEAWSATNRGARARWYVTKTGEASITEFMRWAQGQVQMQSGSAAAPPLTSLSDVDTGIFWPAANALGVALGGTEYFRFTVSGGHGLLTFY